MSTRSLLIYGSGGHGKVVAEAARMQGTWVLLGFIDDDPSKNGSQLKGVPILDSRRIESGATIALGIGSNRLRRRIALDLLARGCVLASIIHPSSSITSDSFIEEGTYVGPQAVIHSDSKIGKGCIINSGATIEHDCTIGDWVHISPRGTLGGGVCVGEGSHVGLGASVLPNLSIGKWTMIGAGAAVISSVGDGVTAVGVPGRIVGPSELGEQ